MNRRAALQETRFAVISARNMSEGVWALLQWEIDPWLSAEDTVGSHNRVNDAATAIEATRKTAPLRRAIGMSFCMGLRARHTVDSPARSSTEIRSGAPRRSR